LSEGADWNAAWDATDTSLTVQEAVNKLAEDAGD